MTGHEQKLLVNDAYNEKGERVAGEVIKYPVYWNLFYEGDEWEEESNEYTHTRYQNFKKDGENLLDKYLESFVGKYEKDYYFYLFFEKYIYRFFPAVEVDRFKSVADDCEYLFHKYNDSLPENKKLKGRRKRKNKKDVVAWERQPVEKWETDQAVSKAIDRLYI